MPSPQLQYLQTGLNQPQVDVPGLGGYAQGMALNQAQQNWNLQNTLNALINQANQAQMAEYGANAPVREMERNLALQYKPREVAAEVGGKEERLKQEQIKTPGLESEIKGKIDRDKLDQWTRDVERMTMAQPMFKGPTAAVDFRRWAKDNDFERTPFYNYIASSPNPEVLQQRYGEVLNSVTMNLAQRRSALESLRATGSQERIADIAGQYGLERQRLANEGALATAQERTAKQNKVEKLEEVLVDLITKLQQTQPGTPQYQQLQQQTQQVFQMLQMIKAAGAPYIPNVGYQGSPLMQPRGPQALPGTSAPQQAPVIRYDAQGNRIQ